MSDEVDKPQLFLTTIPGFTTGLAPEDIPSEPSVANGPGSNPLFGVLELGGFVHDVVERDPQAMAVVNMWASEGRSNWIHALATVIRGRDRALSNELLEKSGALGNPYSWWLAGLWLSPDDWRSPADRDGVVEVLVPRADRIAYLRKAADMQFGPAATALAWYAAGDGNDQQAVAWLVQAARWGDSEALNCLASMVDDPNEARFLAEAAKRLAGDNHSEPGTATEEDVSASYSKLSEQLSPDRLPDWSDLVALRDRNGGRNWVSHVGSEVSADGTGFDWTYHPAIAAEPFPVAGLAPIDIEDDQSIFASRIKASMARAGIIAHEKVTPAGIVGLLSTWGDPGGDTSTIQIAHFYQDPRNPRRECVHIGAQILYIEESPEPAAEGLATTLATCLFESAVFLAETTVRATHVSRLPEHDTDGYDRSHAFPLLPTQKFPLPWLRIARSDRQYAVSWSAGSDGPTSLQSDVVYYAGYILTSDLSDDQLDEMLPSVSVLVQCIALQFKESAKPRVGMASLADLVQSASAQAELDSMVELKAVAELAFDDSLYESASLAEKRDLIVDGKVSAAVVAGEVDNASLVIRHAVLQNSDCPLEFLVSQAVSESEWLRAAVAANSRTPRDIRDALRSDHSWYVREQVLRHPEASADDCRTLVSDAWDEVRAAVAECPAAPLEVLQALQDDPEMHLRLARHPNASAALLIGLCEGASSGTVLSAVMRNSSCPPQLLEQYSTHADSGVREAVASNPTCPTDSLHLLSADEESRVRRAVMENPSSTEEIRVAVLLIGLDDPEGETS